MRQIRFEILEEHAFLKHLVDYTNAAREWKWSYGGRMVVGRNNREIECDGTVEWNDNGGKATLRLPRYGGSYMLGGGSYGKLLPKDEMLRLRAFDDSWRSISANAIGNHSDDYADSLTVNVFHLEVGRLDEAYESHALIIGGGGFPDYPMQLPTDPKGEGAAFDAMITTVFDRPALFRQIKTGEAVDDVMIAYDGKRLDKDEQTALWLLVSFLAGVDCRVTARIDMKGGLEIGRSAYSWTRPRVAPRPPVDWRRWGGAIFELPERLPKMLNAALRVLKDDVYIDVALLHLFAEGRGYLDTDIRDITLALDALVESKVFNTDGATIIPEAAYDTLRVALNTAVGHTVRGAGYPEALVGRLKERIRDANDISHGERRRAFWRRVGFELKSDEKKAINNRHPMSHRGFILRKSDDARMQALLDQTYLARTLVNRCILALLEYDGLALDYSSGRNEPWQYFVDREPAGGETH